MKLRGIVWLLVAAAVAGGLWALMAWRSQPPEVSFAKVVREPISNTVPTNGKVEPVEWAEARAERAGAIVQILIQKGQRVAKDAPLAEIDSADAKADLAAAQARITQARSELDVLGRGGRATDLADISSGLDRARLDAETAQKEYDALLRLQAKQAATAYDVAQAKERLDRAKLQIQGFEQRRAALVSASDRSSAQARLEDAQAAAALAERRIRMSTVRSPIAGTVYQFDLKPGGYLNAGDLVASIGQLNRVLVKVFVDEPDLGRVSKGMPVVITWDAMPGRQWKGEVDKTPTQIVALGTRQVGEVACLIENPNDELLPGTNVNAEIRAQTVEGALTVPKEAVRRELGQAGVFVLAEDHVVWKTVTLGIENTTRVQVQGLNEGDAIALPSDKPLKDGMAVRLKQP